MWYITTILLTIFSFSQVTLASKKADELHKLQLTANGPIKLTGSTFDKYVKSPNRDYAIIGMTTALASNRGCMVCGDANIEYQILVKSFIKHNKNLLDQKKLFFTLIDFDDAGEVFHFLGLNSAPGFFHFSPKFKTKVDRDDKYDLQRQGYEVDKLGGWVSSKLGSSIKIVKPVDYTKLIIVGGSLAAVLIILYSVGFKWSWLYSRTMWSLIIIATILACISGQMWNKIRSPPQMGRSRNGRGMELIAGTSQQQYIFETYYVAFMYFVTSLSVIIMGDLSIRSDSHGKKRIWGFMGACLFLGIFSLLLNVFGKKYGGYPYKLLI